MTRHHDRRYGDTRSRRGPALDGRGTSPLPGSARAAALLAAATLLLGCGAPAADLVFRGGPVYTADPLRPWAEAVAVQGRDIVYVGDAAGAAAWIGAGTEIVEIGEGVLLPGFHDTHVHPVSGGIELGECDLNSAVTRGEIIDLVRACVARTPPGAWVRGGGFQLPLFPAGAPSRALLDSLAPDRPAYLTSSDGHSAWVNSRALDLAGVDEGTLDPPPDGVIVRLPGGAPQGTLRESAMDLVGRHLPAHTGEEVRAGLDRALAMAASFGITTIHEASAREAALRAYREAEEDGDLTARVIVSSYVDPDEGAAAAVARLAALRERYAGELVRPVAAKLFVDGVIEGGTAALLEPYLDRPDARGELNWPPDALAAAVAALDDAGFKVHLHAIGDRAIRAGLDAFEAQARRDGGAGPRHIMAHIQLFDPADVPRFAALGVVASFQPLWAYADTYITELTEPRLGAARSRWLYPIASVARSGAILAAGSDWSVTSMNPLEAMEVAVTRRDPAAGPGPPWIPEEVVDLETILRAYTAGGALAGDLEAVTGSIAVGKRADLVLLDRNPFERPPTEIGDAVVEMTVFEGRTVFRRP